MSNIDKHAELRKELSNPAIGSNAHLRKLALALLDELEAAEKRIPELEAREVQLPPKAPDNLASCLDGYEKWLIATTFRDTWNACLAEVVRVNAAAGKGEAS